MSVESRAALMGASIDVKLDGKIYHASRLGDRDIVELDLYVRNKYIQLARQSFDDTMSDADKDREMAAARKEALQITAFSEEGMRIFTTFDGIARLAWQSIKRNHPEIKLDDFTATLFDTSRGEKEQVEQAQANIDAFNEVFQQVNNTPKLKVPEPSKKVQAPAPVLTIRQRRQRKMSTES